MNWHEIFKSDADDSELFVMEYNANRIVFLVTLDVAGGQRVKITLPKPEHLDMPPNIMLGSITFGDCTLLPNNYLGVRYKHYDGDVDKLKVVKVVEQSDEDVFYALYYQQETFEYVDKDVRA